VKGSIKGGGGEKLPGGKEMLATVNVLGTVRSCREAADRVQRGNEDQGWLLSKGLSRALKEKSLSSSTPKGEEFSKKRSSGVQQKKKGDALRWAEKRMKKGRERIPSPAEDKGESLREKR